MGTMYKYVRSDTWSATLKAIVMPGGQSQFNFDIVIDGFSLHISLIREYNNAVDHNRTYGFLQEQLLYNKNKDTQDGEEGYPFINCLYSKVAVLIRSNPKLSE